jgi:hypothetical protein
MTVQSQIAGSLPGEASTKQVLIQDPGLMELTECELEGISGGDGSMISPA